MGVSTRFPVKNAIKFITIKQKKNLNKDYNNINTTLELGKNLVFTHVRF